MFAGVDSHKDTLAACVVDDTGREIRADTFENSPAGHRKLVAWLKEAGEIDRVGVECSATYGAGLCRVVRERGLRAVEVPPKMSVRERGRLRRLGKSDPADALAIARVTARESALPPVGKPRAATDLEVLVNFRDELVRERTLTANRLHCDLVVLSPGYSKRCPSLTTDDRLSLALRILRPHRSLHADVARRRVARLRQLDRQIVELRAEIEGHVKATRTRLTAIHGVGPLIAARLLAEVGDVRRFATSDRFAMANGTAPIPASSGRVVRHRLNRGGNRKLNRALYQMALTQAHYHQPARDYLARKRAAGKSGKEAIRCLMRRLSDVVYRTLCQDLAIPAAAT